MIAQVLSKGLNVQGMIRSYCPTVCPVTGPTGEHLTQGGNKHKIQFQMSASSAQKYNFKESISWERCLTINYVAQRANIGLMQQKAAI